MKQTSYELFFSQEKEENRNINEFETRKLVDFKLNLSGWIADSVKLKYSKGARPEKNKCLAISEWPTQSGPADYVLFNGLIPIGAIEAKRRNKDVAAKIDQAERYSRDFTILEGMEDISKSRSFKIPFVFSTNGRKFNNNLPTKSGIWFKNLLQKKKGCMAMALLMILIVQKH